MTDERVIRAMLRFGVDAGGADQAKKKIGDLTREFSKLEQQAKDVQGAIEIRQRTGQGYDDLSSKLNGLTAKMKATSQAAKQLKKDAEAALNASGEKLQMVGGNLSQAGRGMLTAGGAVLGGAFMGAKGFVDKNPQSAVAQEWLKATSALETSYDRIGKVMAETLLPVMETAARITDKLAAFVEKNPGAVEAILGGAAVLAGAGGGLMAVGGALSTAGTIMKSVSALSALLGPGGALAGVGSALGPILGTVAGVGAAGAGGLALGGLAYKGLATANNALGGSMNAKAIEQGFSIAAYTAGKLTDSLGLTENAARDWFIATSDATNATDEQTQAALAAAAALKQVQPPGGAGTGLSGGLSPDERQERNDAVKAAAAYQQSYDRGLEMFIAYQEQETEAADRYGEQRQQIIDDGNAAALQAQLDYSDERGKLITAAGEEDARAQAQHDAAQTRAARDFAAEEAQTEADYYADRLRAARDFGEEVLRAEEDHQRDMCYAAEDHADDVRDLAGQNDAYGLVKAQRAYEKERRRKEEEYNVEAARRNKDYAVQLADEEQSFRKERDQRLAAFQQRQTDAQADFNAQRQQRAEDQRQRLAEFDANFKAEQAKRTTQNQTRLDDLKGQFDKEQIKRADDFKKRLTDLDAALTGETAARREFYRVSAADFDNYLKALISGKPYKPGENIKTFFPQATPKPVAAQANGGYAAYPGLYLRGEAGAEYVLDAPTTRAAESALGGRIEKAALVAALRGQRAGSGLTLNLGGISITGGGSPEALARQVTDQVFGQLVPIFRRAAGAA